MGLTGLEPVTLRLSSACSNQLSYRPGSRLRRGIFECRLPISIDSFGALRAELFKSAIPNRKSKVKQAGRVSDYKCRFTNARPEADFRYRSKSAARTRSESATYVFNRHGGHFTVWRIRPAL